MLHLVFSRRFVFGSLISTGYDRIRLNGKKSTVFRKCEYVYKTTRTHKSRCKPAKFRSEKTINMAFVSSHIDLKKPCLGFLAHAFVIFLQEDKVLKGEK